MKKILLGLLLIVTSANCFASHVVRGYERHDGTYVQPHHSMNPDESKTTGSSYKHDTLVPRDNTKDNNYTYY